MTRVLVPVAVLEGGTISSGLMHLLGTVDVTVLGYHVPPDQTGSDQARSQFEERAKSALEDIAQEFRQAGGDADYRLVFTHDRQQSINRVAEDTNSRAIVTPGATGDLERILVSLTGKVAVDRILTFVEELIDDRDIGVTLFVVSEATNEDSPLLEESKARLEGAGIAVQTEVATGPTVEAIVDAVPGHDAIVVGEKAPSLASLVLGEESERVASGAVSPVLVVREDEELDT